MLEVEGLTKRYGSLLALDDVGFTAEPGQIVGLLGPNGAGKTTSMRSIMGLVALDRGEVRWNGGALDRKVRRRFGYMPAERGMYQRMSIRDHLVYYARLSGLDEASATATADGWLERLGLTERAGDPVQALSSGNQQRVQLALALLNEPELLVLDEPFSGLDPVAVDTLGEILAELVAAGTALVLSSHQLDLVADVCSTVVIIDHGQVVLRGDVADLRAASSTRYLEVEFAQPTSWTPSTGVAVDADEGGRRYRATLAAGSDARDLLAEALSLGEVTGYSFAPPDLSEVFLGVVGRSTIEDAEDAGPAEPAGSASAEGASA